LVPDFGGAEFQTAGNLMVVEDLKRGSNPAEKGGRPKDIFEIASKKGPGRGAVRIAFGEPRCPLLTILGFFRLEVVSKSQIRFKGPRQERDFASNFVY